MRRLILCCVLLLLAAPCKGKELGGVLIQESIRTGDGTELFLNGAGIREKFFFDIYIAALYTAEPGTSADSVIGPDVPKRVLMHFLYSKVEREKLVDAWLEGFEANMTAESFGAMKPQIDRFNQMFGDVVKGEEILLDYLPGKGTSVVIGGEEKGVIPGKDFNDALLQIWLGKEPVTSGLKKALLAGKD